ncbi:hypothetical protein BDK51DRAFT_39384 [Blyttiomyces helicus]|uniref:Uncharacterized protein n=1 Tax=Blyttiomyces helicus TaxID=388810 RepID=A0A4P9WLV4_9FUNG|nr:hypothetical protein BDK51DRAFT_39384 [Blyttiomyces helicus]|eukprot:RKO94031.1 hypothetical protein BDK51DRAFT_39384 [Blyttiomyces helicus]
MLTNVFALQTSISREIFDALTPILEDKAMTNAPFVIASPLTTDTSAAIPIHNGDGSMPATPSTDENGTPAPGRRLRRLPKFLPHWISGRRVKKKKRRVEEEGEREAPPLSVFQTKLSAFMDSVQANEERRLAPSRILTPLAFTLAQVNARASDNAEESIVSPVSFSHLIMFLLLVVLGRILAFVRMQHSLRLGISVIGCIPDIDQPVVEGGKSCNQRSCGRDPITAAADRDQEDVEA